MTPSTFDLARFQASLPLELTISAICWVSFATSSRNASRSDLMSPPAAEAALALSLTASLASLIVSRASEDMLLGVVDMYLPPQNKGKLACAANRAQAKKFR